MYKTTSAFNYLLIFFSVIFVPVCCEWCLRSPVSDENEGIPIEVHVDPVEKDPEPAVCQARVYPERRQHRESLIRYVLAKACTVCI